MKLIRSLVFAVLAAWTAAAEPVDFSLESPVDGKVLKAAELRGKFVALHFLLKTECPFCLKHTHDYAMKAASLPNVVQVFVKPDSAEEIKSWAAKVNRAPNFPSVTVYRDADAQLAEKLKILNGYQFHGETVHFPALILLDPKGDEVFRYVGKNNTDRYSFEKLTSKISELNGKPAIAAIEHYNVGPNKLALQGYDPVSYFTKNVAVKGSPAVKTNYRGVTYQFASPENKKAFTDNPDKYLPTYGGWCATAMAKGEKVEIDPANFKVTDGRLYLFFKAFYGNALKDWNKDEANLMTKADANWKKISGE
jgi:thioredoxin-dependent peroxiredoxin